MESYLFLHSVAKNILLLEKRLKNLELKTTQSLSVTFAQNMCLYSNTESHSKQFFDISSYDMSLGKRETRNRSPIYKERERY